MFMNASQMPQGLTYTAIFLSIPTNIFISVPTTTGLHAVHITGI